MKVSFVIIAYNEEANIISCIKSIQGLKELPKEHEIIVVNDGSKDTTSQIVDSYSVKNKSVKLIDQENLGRGAARATGIDAVSGDVIAMLDADIILPPDWLNLCVSALKQYDAVSCTPVPDGDVAYLYNRFRLKPKPTVSTTEITGSNGLYRSAIFKHLKFNHELREGEDTNFNYRMIKAGYKLKRLPDATVLHQESKSFKTSLHWLYQNGVGAMRQLITFKVVQLPDLAFFGFWVSIILAAAGLLLLHGWEFCLVPILYILLTSYLHIRMKFYHSFSLNYLNTVIVNSIFIFSYYLGRTVGLLSLRRETIG